jgi:hypothetical protein
MCDQGTPVPLRYCLSHREVATANELGWATLKNAQLLDAAEAAGFSVLLTTDSHLFYPQNLVAKRIAILVLGSTSWPRIRTVATEMVYAVDACADGGCAELSIS